MLPTQIDIEKRKKNLDKFLGQIDPVTGKTAEKKAISVVRGAIRQAWMKSPTKLAYLYSKTYPDMNPATRTKWLVDCECCGGSFKTTDVEVDHIQGCNAFSTVEQFEDYFRTILLAGFDDLQILCKECHAIKTLQDKLGLTFDQAAIEKQVIAICKEKADKVFRWIASHDTTPAKNAKERKNQVRNILTDIANSIKPDRITS